MKEQDVLALLAFGREQRRVEFKGPGSRGDKVFFAKVVRAVLGMANLPDGGVVIVGVDEANGALTPTGLSEEQASTWNYDHVAKALSNYADPYVDLDCGLVTVEGKTLAVLEVQPFDDLPVICKKGEDSSKLKKGALYVRVRGKIETVEVPSHVEMREVLDRAAEIRARKLIRATIGLLGGAPAAPSSDERFDAEIQDLR